MIECNASVCSGLYEPWEVQRIKIDEPGPHDVLIDMKFAGLCHSDEHVRLGDTAADPEYVKSLGADSLFPVIGGHEGAGVVKEVGSNVDGFQAGDHVVTVFVPACGRCVWCASGRQHLCDLGASTLAGPMIGDSIWRHRIDGQPTNRMFQVGTFSQALLTDSRSLIKIPVDVPLDVAAVVSCGIATGFGSSVNRGKVTPGDVVVVVGLGGVGHGAIMGAVLAGARAVVAVDPLLQKREHALEVGATHTAESMSDAMPIVSDLTEGQMAEVAVMTPSLLKGEYIAEALPLVAKGGRVVCTAVSPSTSADIKGSLFDLAMSDKALLGSLYGSTSPREQIPRILSLYRAGALPLEKIISRRYQLSEVTKAYEDMESGSIIRGVIDFS